MSPKLKILLITLALITLSVVLYAVFIVREQFRGPQHTDNTSTTQQNTTSQTSPQNTPSSENPSNTTMPTPEPSTPPATVPSIPQTLSDPSANQHIYMPISKISCDNNCHQFTKDTDAQYCQQYCSFKAPDTIENCADLKNLHQDYCFKGQAIDKTDPAICKKITDDNIRIACQNRVLEDVVDKAKLQ